MLEVAPEKLGGTVEIDETYVAGKKRRWRAKGAVSVVIGIRQRNGDLRLIRAKDAKSATVKEIINANVGGHVEVILTDEAAIYPYALDKMQKNIHRTINHSAEYAHGDVHTNTVESALLSSQARHCGERGIKSLRSISRPTLTKCASASITARISSFSAIHLLN